MSGESSIERFHELASAFVERDLSPVALVELIGSLALMRKYVLYVIELRDSVAKRAKVVRNSPEMPYLYVGYTSRSRSIRLREHRQGRFSGDRKWMHHYVRARPDLYRSWPSYRSQDDALRGERELSADLNRRGYTVVNKTGEPLNLTRRQEP